MRASAGDGRVTGVGRANGIVGAVFQHPIADARCARQAQGAGVARLAGLALVGGCVGTTLFGVAGPGGAGICTTDQCICFPDYECGGGYCSCQFTPDSTCGVPAVCNDVGAIGVLDASAAPAGQFVKVSGVIALGDYSVCDDALCGGCTGDMALSNADNRLALVPKPTITGELFEPWECVTEGCDQTLTCGSAATPQAGVSYWAWGLTEHYDPLSTGASNALPKRLVVQGWCPQIANNSPNRYEGTLTDSYNGPIPMTVDVTADGDSVEVAIGPLDCANCTPPAPAQWASDVSLSDDKLKFFANIPGFGLLEVASFQLAFDGNTLSGWYEGGWGTVSPNPRAPGTVIPPSGFVSLTRVE